ncbi:hypothetical protein cyc_02126 [Cyclospora cayetanensis]|uniref:Uncharacterized protein n=1 Tax=Cyclospora cayetanensis TaxID=88456 RepID=A0A1D3CWQ9_9EIME|nr:hypothetical protein cyc_02126 [Cyclospora cayetanensis]
MSANAPLKIIKAPPLPAPAGRRPIGFRGNHQHKKALYDPVFRTTKVRSHVVAAACVFRSIFLLNRTSIDGTEEECQSWCRRGCCSKEAAVETPQSSSVAGRRVLQQSMWSNVQQEPLAVFLRLAMQRYLSACNKDGQSADELQRKDGDRKAPLCCQTDRSCAFKVGKELGLGVDYSLNRLGVGRLHLMKTTSEGMLFCASSGCFLPTVKKPHSAFAAFDEEQRHSLLSSLRSRAVAWSIEGEAGEEADSDREDDIDEEAEDLKRFLMNRNENKHIVQRLH